MRQTIVGVLLGLVLASVGMVWWQARATVESNAPPPPEPEIMPGPDELPITDGSGMQGPTPPEVSARTKEQMRFDRYDRNRDNLISRNEMLSTRTAAFRKLDKDGNNLLSFEEWAVATVDKFEGADSDGNGTLTRSEFATTAPKPVVQKPACKC